MLQLHVSDRWFYCLLRCVLYYRLDGTCIYWEVLKRDEYWWLGATLWYLQCVSNKDTSMYKDDSMYVTSVTRVGSQYLWWWWQFWSLRLGALRHGVDLYGRIHGLRYGLCNSRRNALWHGLWHCLWHALWHRPRRQRATRRRRHNRRLLWCRRGAWPNLKHDSTNLLREVVHWPSRWTLLDS